MLRMQGDPELEQLLASLVALDGDRDALAARIERRRAELASAVIVAEYARLRQVARVPKLRPTPPAKTRRQTPAVAPVGSWWVTATPEAFTVRAMTEQLQRMAASREARLVPGDQHVN